MRRPVVLTVIAGLAFVTSALAQVTAGSAGISGTVHDASGAAIPGAQVIVSNESKGIRRTMDTTEAGVFAAPSLVPATGYTVTVNKAGFSSYELKEIQLQVGQNLGLEVILQIAGSTTQ